MKAMLHPLPVLLFLAVGVAGCAGGKDETAKQLDELRKEVVALRASYAGLRDQLDSMAETGETPSRSEEGGDASTEQPADRPSLEVVHLSPEEEPGAAPPPPPAPVDDSPPIVIRGDESGVEEVEPGAGEAKPKAPRPGYKQVPKGR